MSESSHQHKMGAPKQLNFTVIVSSSSRYEKLKARQPVTDPSGDLLVELITGAGHKVASRELLPDDGVLIGKYVSKAIATPEVDAIIICGGTGVSITDVTIETVRPMMIKTLPGFGELFRKLSYDEIGSAAIMTRALAGVTDQGKVVFCIPGSPNAVKLVMTKLILPETGHIRKHAREM
ncbi:MAG: MogA/MoaB family molybdenum cofactor biosynthesis protein [Candidatus Bathyarchaeota archaeon]|nr:MogA/MoaB family molybdenum cofactor biosynthesis protein [Candidatus Bathyarchaeota archaeon]